MPLHDDSTHFVFVSCIPDTLTQCFDWDLAISTAYSFDLGRWTAFVIVMACGSARSLGKFISGLAKSKELPASADFWYHRNSF